MGWGVKAGRQEKEGETGGMARGGWENNLSYNKNKREHQKDIKMYDYKNVRVAPLFKNRKKNYERELSNNYCLIRGRRKRVCTSANLERLDVGQYGKGGKSKTKLFKPPGGQL